MSEITETDVCIIGAGPGGAATSIMLSNLKIPHYIIDKATFPRDKTCGDGLILYAYKSMKILGDHIFKDFLKNPKFIHSKSIKLHINDNLNLKFSESEDRDMVISYARRIDFDQFLVNYLSDEYAKKDFGNAVKSLEEKPNGILVKLKDGKQILSKLVVGADGAQSVVSRKLTDRKINQKYISTFVTTYFDGIKDIPLGNEGEVRIIYKKMPLFFYILPVSNGQANITLGGRSDQLLKYNINLIEEVEKYILTDKLMSKKFVNANKLGKWRGWTIPFHFGKHKMSGNRFLLVGDAAGLANAFYKEGVGTAMMSGVIAARNIEKCLEINDFSENALKKYDTEVKQEFGKLLKFSLYVLRISRFKNLFFKLVKLSSKIFERMAFKAIEKRSY